MILIAIFLMAWFLISVAGGLLFGRMIALRDRQVPHRPEMDLAARKQA